MKITSWGLLLIMLLPLWVLWVYSYTSLIGLQGETEELPRFFGMHLYKKQIRGQLERFVAAVDLLEREQPEAGNKDPAKAFPQEEVEKMAGLFGLHRPLLVVQQDEFRLLYPATPTGELAAILKGSDYEQTFLDALKRIAIEDSQEGYFSIDTDNTSSGSGDMYWFLSAPSSKDRLLYLLLVPESALKQSGSLLQSAHEALLREHVRQYLFSTLPVLFFTSLLTGLLYYQRHSPGREDNS